MDNAKELTAAQRRLVSWLATPQYEREPHTLDAMAAEIGVRPATIRRWRVHNLDAIATQQARMRLLEYVPSVYQTLARKAEDGSREHIELFMKIITGQLGGEGIEMEPKRGKAGDSYA